MNKFFYTILFITIVFSESLFAAPSVQFSEQELVFSGRMRSAKLSLVNRGDVTSTVTLNFLQPIYHERQNEYEIDNFNTHNVKDITLDYFPYNFKLKNSIRITPRRITLKPGEKQAVRLVLKKPVDLLDGVYRANIAIDYIDVIHEELENLKPVDETKVAVGMGFVTSIHIPLIIIHGSVETSLDEFKVLKITKKSLDKITRHANYNVLMSYKISGNSIGQYIIKIYTDLDPENPILNKTEEIDNFTNYHVKSYQMNIDEGATKLRVVIEQLGSLEVLQDVTKDIKTLY